mgnify:CR=1 FL=1
MRTATKSSPVDLVEIALAMTVLLLGWPVAADPLPAPTGAAPARCLVDDVFGGMMPDPAVMAVGAGGCGTASCHGGPAAGNHDVQSFSATLWTQFDPHARAYETLHGPRSRKMAALLGIGEAHRAQRCLACHSSQADREAALPPEVLADGVSCGSCHGDATRWVTIHHQPDWKHTDPAARADLGYRELRTATQRVRTCIPCHVGDASREVDHDMIAAGHPRLAFEFAAYERIWPRHWNPRQRTESDADFAERSWAIGQAETLAAVALLTEVRARRAAGNTVRWPEFAEFDCYACHRPLSPERVANATTGGFANPVPGTPSWQPWAVSAARLLAASTGAASARSTSHTAADLRAVFDRGWATANRDRLHDVIVRARALERAAAAASGDLAARERIWLDASDGRLDATVAADPAEWRFWDAAAQTALLMDSALDGGPARLGLWHAAEPPDETRAALDVLRAGLRFPPGEGGPDGFDPAEFQRDRAMVPHLRAGPR